MGSKDKEQAVFEQIAIRDVKKWISTALKIFNNSTIIMSDNSYKTRIP